MKGETVAEKDRNGIGALLASATAQRTRLQQAMNGLLTPVCLTLMTLWFFVPFFILPWLSRRYIGRMSRELVVTIILVTGFTALILGLWRLYLKRLDNELAHLYPDLYLYEILLGAPPRRGTPGHLRRSVPKLRLLLEDDTAPPR